MHILVTGGAGYIGSHALIELVKAGFNPVVYDNLSNSSVSAVQRVSKIVGCKIDFVQADVQDTKALHKVFERYDFASVIHFAGLKAVGESVAKPLAYYANNVTGTLCLLEAMQKFGVGRLVFSSSATVYGNPKSLPIDETAPCAATNPYGQTKLMVEHILQDVCATGFDAISLRYFNPIGAHPSGLIGENPTGIPNNLMPYISQVAVGKLNRLCVYGDDYDTPDGTGVRDYIHVCDLARGHVLALHWLLKTASVGFLPINLGTGRGTSVLELVAAFENATGQKVPYVITGRRAGDIASCYASVDKAHRLLGFLSQLDIQSACADAWRWQSQNPNGYDD